MKQSFRILLIIFLGCATQPTQAQCGLDVFIANDQSGSVDAIENSQGRHFITELMRNLDPWGNAINQSRMAIAQWDYSGSWTQYNFPSVGQNYTTQLSDVIAFQNSTRILYGGTNPYSALLETYNSINQTPISGRTAGQVIILMTDALCNEIQNDIVQLATQIKDNGIYVMVLAIDGAQGCTILQGENVASAGGYFSAPSYAQLEQQAINYVRDIIGAACIGPPPPTFDLTMNLNSFTVVNCISGTGTYKADYTINNIGKVAWNNNITISFYNGDPTLPTTQLVSTQNIGIQNISVNGSINGSFTSSLLGTTNYLFAIINFNGNLSINEPPLPYNLKDKLVIAGEKNEKNNFSNGIVRVNDNTCSPKAVLNVDVQAGGVGCNNTVNYNIEICNTGNATAIIDEIDPIAPPNFVLNNSTSVTDTALKRIWATYYGGNLNDVGRAIAVNKQGDIYMVGQTNSTINIATLGSHQPSNGGNQDAFLVKFNSSGVRQWATYYGGSNDDAAYAIELDTLGNIYMSGSTTSGNNIATAGSHQTVHGGSGNQDAFLVKFNSSGVRQWATYYGGSGSDFAYALAIDLLGNIYISGATTISNNIATIGSHQTANGGTQDAFLVKFNSSGIRQWATYYGGNGNEISYALAADKQGYIYMAGSTLSSNNISTVVSHQPNIVAGARDAFLVKFDSTGMRQWATYYGGSGSGGDIANSLKIDAQDNVYMVGYTNSFNNIATIGSHQSSYGGSNNYDAFLVKFNGLGTRQWGTYYGGSSDDYGYGLNLDGQGNIYLVGSAGSNNNIATNDAYQTALDGSSNTFLVKFNASGVRQWGTYYGGDGRGFAVANDNQGNIYIAGSTTSTNNIATIGSHQEIYGNSTDAFLVKFNQNSLLTINPNECIKRQYTYAYSSVPAGTYNFSIGIIAQKYLLTDGTPLILPDSNFNAGTFTNIDGFNGANHTSDNVTISGNTAACSPGDKVNVLVSIPTTSGCGSGNYVQATVTINNTSGVTMFNPKLYLNLTGTGASFAGELYNITNNISIPSPNIFAGTYPNVANALYGKTGVQALPIYQLPAGTSTFNIDINLGSTLTNLSIRVDSLPTIFNASGSSNLATDVQGVSIPALPGITGFSCPAAITAGNTITFSGISVTNASTIKWASTTVANIPNTGSLTNPSITYSLTPADLANGFVAISLTALNSAGCDVSRSCQIAINNVVYDYGDAPITYDLNKNVVPFAGSSTLLTGVHLGTTAPTTETTAKNSADAKGDGVEEDGLQTSTCSPKPINLQLFPLLLKATNNSGIQAYVSAFADWNNDGDYLDDGETIKKVGTVPASSGIQNYTLNFIPETANTALTQYFVRLRISTDSNSIKQPYEASPQGEIEDHVMEVGLSETNIQFDFNICQGDSVTVNNKTYRITGTYYDTLVNPTGCDTILITNLTVYPRPSRTQNISICANESYTIGTHTYTQAGTYKDTFQTALGCDSIVTTIISVTALQTAIRNVSICNGEQLVIGTHIYTTGGIYKDTLNASVGCDTILTTNLTVRPTPMRTQNISICANESYTIGTHTYTQAGTYKDTFQTNFGCDSIVTTIINVTALQTITRNVSICNGEQLVIGTHIYTTGGIYKDTLNASVGCDTILTTNLTVRPTPTRTQNISICTNGSYTIGTHTYTQAGTYKDTLQTSFGCDSIVTTIIIVAGLQTVTRNVSICSGEQLVIGNNTYTTSGIYKDTISGNAGCDTLLTTNLTVHPKPTRTQNISICANESYTIGTHTYTQAGTYKDTFQTNFGCDSIVTTIISVTALQTAIRNVSICNGEQLVIGTHIYTTGGIYKDTLNASVGCDTILTTNLTVHPTPTRTQNISICSNESYTIGSHTYTQAGIYKDTLQTNLGCDSIVTTIISVTALQTAIRNVSICNGEQLVIGTHIYTTGGIYKDTLNASVGCDTILTTNLTVRPTPTRTQNISICANESYTIDTHTYTQAGTYKDTFQTNFGCDSIVTTIINVTALQTITRNVSICSGEQLVIGNNTYTSSGIYKDTLNASVGCDTILTTNLTVRPTPTRTQNISICTNGSYTIGTHTYTQAGTYKDTLQTSLGCDSIVTTIINVTALQTITRNVSICSGEQLVIGNNTYTTSGIYKDTIRGSAGCDTLLTTNLTVHPTPTRTQNISICTNGSYTIGTHTYTQAGTFKDTLQTNFGCDSIVTTIINVTALQTITRNVSICNGEQLVIGNNTYTTSGIYKDTISGSAGCDTLLTTNLTVHPTPSRTQNISICTNGSYTIGSHTYTQAGTFKDTLQTSLGCDSIVTTIINVTALQTTTRNVSICNGEQLVIGNNTYTTSGIYKDTISSSAGCDTLLTTNLTVHPTPTRTQNISICTNGSYTIGTHTYTQAGTFKDTLQTSLGCDSIVTTIINVTALQTTTRNVSICNGEQLVIGNNTYTTSGIYKDTISSSAGCDTLLTTNLTVYLKPIVNLGNNVSVCPDSIITLDAGNIGAAYQWNNAQTTQQISAINAGTYIVTVTKDICSASDTIIIQHKPVFKVDLGLDVTLCNKETLVLNATTSGGSYIWQDGTTLPTYSVNQEGIYYVEVNTECSVSSDTIIVKDGECDCNYFIPTAFSPNSDGVNDEYGVANICEGVTYFKLELFNRWGELVFQSDNEKDKWNGFYQGLAQQMDDYIYILTYTQNNKDYYNKGSFSLFK